MTVEEAVNIIEERVRVTEYVDSSYVDCVDIEALRMAISALKKQIQKELIAEGDGYADGEMVYDSFYCPSCDHYMEEDEVEDYCPKCGQKICWEKE